MFSLLTSPIIDQIEYYKTVEPTTVTMAKIESGEITPVHLHIRSGGDQKQHVGLFKGQRCNIRRIPPRPEFKQVKPTYQTGYMAIVCTEDEQSRKYLLDMTVLSIQHDRVYFAREDNAFYVLAADILVSDQEKLKKQLYDIMFELTQGCMEEGTRLYKRFAEIEPLSIQIN